MLAEACRRTGTNSPAIEFHAGDVARLDFPDFAFDGVTCERVFQHLDEPEAAIGELVRVTKPGGRIVVIDTDWGMHAIHGADPDVTARIIACWSNRAANGSSGRQLPALFVSAGVADPVVVAETFTTTDPKRPTVARFTTMADTAANAGAISDDQAVSWLADLADAGATGSFFWALTMFAVGGVRHSPTSSTPATKHEENQ